MQPGTHTVNVVSTDFSFTRQGTPDLAVRFALDSDPEDQITGHIYLSDAAMGMARKSLKAMGFDVDALPFEDIVNDSNKLKGAKCSIVVEEEIYNDTAQLKVKYINALVDAKKAKSVAASLTAKLRAAKKKDSAEPDVSLEIDPSKIPF